MATVVLDDRASSLPNTARKLSRKSGAKVHSGCQGCKLRHVKCDETKPNCLKCTSAGRYCQYHHGHFRRFVNTNKLEKSSTASQAQRRTDNPLVITLEYKSLPAGNEHEYSALVTFHQHYLSLFFTLTSDHHLRLNILELCSDAPEVRHAVIALGAHYRTAGFAATHSGCDVVITKWKEMALQNYQIAIRGLSMLLAHNSRDPAYLVRFLITTLLCYGFETLNSRLQNAFIHLNAACKTLILSPATFLDYHHISVLSVLTAMFRRLDIGATMRFNSRPQVFQTGIEGFVHSTNLEQFESLQDARVALEILQCRVQAFLTLDIGRQTKDAISLEKRKYLMQELLAFANRLSDICQSPDDATEHDKLWAHYLMVFIQCGAGTSGGECRYDEYLSSFEMITQHAQRVVIDLRARSLAVQAVDHLSVAINAGLANTLYFVSLKCRDGFLRYRALDLLQEVLTLERSQCHLMLLLARAAVQEEEEAAQTTSSGVQAASIPEYDRVQDVTLHIHEGQRSGRIILTRVTQDGIIYETRRKLAW